MTHLPGSSACLPACCGLSCLPSSACHAVPCLAALPRDSTGSGSEQGPPALSNPLKTHPWWCSPCKQGREPHSCFIAKHHLTHTFVCCCGGQWMPPKLTLVVKSLAPFYGWGKRGTEQGDDLPGVILGDRQKNLRLRPTCGWARRCWPKRSAQHFSWQHPSPKPPLCFPVGVLCPASAPHPPAQPCSPHMQACAEEVSTQGWRPHGWRELNN